MATQTGSIDLTASNGVRLYAEGQYTTLAGDLSENYYAKSDFSVAPDQIISRVSATEAAVRGTFATCSTAAGTTAKAATITPANSDWALYVGATVTVKFTNANTVASPTLNVNGKGAKPIRDYAGNALSADAYKWVAGACMDFTYDGTNWRVQDSAQLERLSSAEAAITVNATNIESKVSEDGVISSINQSAESVKIAASKVEIDGTAIFTAISSDVDDAITGKGYATTTQVATAKSEAISAQRIWYAECATAAATVAKVATISPATTNFSLTPGQTVNVKFSVLNTGAVASLTLNVNSTGAKSIKYLANGAIANIPNANYLRANQIVPFTYDGTYWVADFSYNSDTYNRTRMQNVITAATAITAAHIVCGTSAGYKNIAAGVQFDLSYPLLYASSAIEAAGTGDNNYLQINSVNAANNGTIETGTNYSTLYLKGTVAGNLFTIAASPFLTTVQPTTENGLFYIPLGVFYNSTTNIYFNSSKDLYAYVDGRFRQVNPTDIVATQRVYYRSKVSGTVPAPTAWITLATDKYNDTASVGDAGWSTKVTPIATNADSGTAKYPYLYTCEQRKRLDGTVACTAVLLDDATTVIDGGNIITGTVTANKLDAADINASNSLTVGALTADAQAELANDPSASASGTLVTASDALVAPPRDLVVYGLSEQDGTPSPSSPVEIQSVGSLNLLDKSIFSNAVTSNKYYELVLEPSTTYYVSTTLPKNNGNSANFFAYNSSSSPVTNTNGLWDGQTRIVTTTSDGKVLLMYRTMNYADTSAAWFMSHDFQITKGGFAPFVGNQSLGLRVGGRNMLDKSMLAPTTALQYLRLLLSPNTTYTISTTLPTQPSGTVYNLFAYNSSGSASSTTNGVGIGHPITFTTLSDGVAIVAYRTDNYADTSAEWYLDHDIQLELGSTATEYEPYESVTAPIPLDGHALRSLPDGTRDELRLTYEGSGTADGSGRYRATLVQRVGAVAMNALTWTKDGSSYVFYATVSGMRTHDEGAMPVCEAYENRAALKNLGSVRTNLADGKICTAYDVNTPYFYARNDSTTTIAAWNAALTDATVIYPLATESEVDLGTVELPTLPSPEFTAWVDSTLTPELSLGYWRDSTAGQTAYAQERATADGLSDLGSTVDSVSGAVNAYAQWLTFGTDDGLRIGDASGTSYQRLTSTSQEFYSDGEKVMETSGGSLRATGALVAQEVHLGSFAWVGNPVNGNIELRFFG